MLCLSFHSALHATHCDSHDHTIGTIAPFIIPSHRSKIAASAVYMYNSHTFNSSRRAACATRRYPFRDFCKQRSLSIYTIVHTPVFCVVHCYFLSCYPTVLLCTLLFLTFPSRLHSILTTSSSSRFTTLFDGAHEFMNSILLIPPGAGILPPSPSGLFVFPFSVYIQHRGIWVFICVSFTLGHPGISKNSRTHALLR
jgi:hypothetical protein